MKKEKKGEKFMNNELSINNEIDLNNNMKEVTLEKQKGFLESNLGQVINRRRKYRSKSTFTRCN